MSVTEQAFSVGAPEGPDIDLAGINLSPEELEPALPDLHLAELIDPEATARGFLELLGEGAGFVFGEADHPELWAFSADELDRMAPALARWGQRNVQIGAVLTKSDEATVVFGLGRYALRNMRAKGDIRRAREHPDDAERAAAQPPASRDGLPAARADEQPGPSDSTAGNGSAVGARITRRGWSHGGHADADDGALD